jgi:hypothetical protein
MKKSLYALALSALLFSLCTIGSNAGTLVTISKSRKLADEERSVSGFRGIASSGSYDVKISMGNKEGLRLAGDSEEINEIETVVEKGILKIRNKSKSGWNMKFRRGKVTVYVDAKSLNSITLSGSGNVSVNGLVKASQLTNTLSGSGKIMLSTDTENYLGTISGSGEIVVNGTADYAKINVNGSGDFEGINLKTSEARIAISGSGNASIHTDKYLHAAISGSGNVRYSGNAKVTQSKSGSGKISRI